jgi:anti-sigma factor RsiW
MSDQSNHVEQKIQAWLDGELTAEEAKSVESHCLSCEKCEELWRGQLRIRKMLSAHDASQPSGPMWPAVEERLHGATSSRFGFPFALGTSAAAVAGIVLGVFLGAINESSYENGEQDVWSEVGSTMTVESNPGLSGFYLDTTDD